MLCIDIMQIGTYNSHDFVSNVLVTTIMLEPWNQKNLRTVIILRKKHQCLNFCKRKLH